MRVGAALTLVAAAAAATVCAAAKLNGINFLNGEWSADKYNSARAYQSLADAKSQTAVNSIAMTFCWYQASIDAPGPIYQRAGITPTDDEITGTVNAAHAAGLSVLFRPCVDPVRQAPPWLLGSYSQPRYRHRHAHVW